ncbi:MAG: hypothetical protein H6765_08395 [Candidatus Peribacteria bacterium]|nr:MAG: hypothetical protein H6765_08395 [Candidatus Peribacteria bacterium]
MKNSLLTVIFLFVACIAFGQSPTASESRPTIHSMTELYLRTMMEFTKSDDILWEPYLTSSKSCKLLYEGQRYLLTLLSPEDAMSGEKLTQTEDNSMFSANINLRIENVSRKSPASMEEVLALLNTQVNKKFYWSKREGVNRTLKQYEITQTQWYDLKMQGDETLAQTLTTAVERLAGSSEGIKVVVREDLSLAYALTDGAVYVVVHNTQDHEIGVAVQEKPNADYCADYVPSHKLYLVKYTVPKVQAGKAQLTFALDQGMIFTSHLGEDPDQL